MEEFHNFLGKLAFHCCFVTCKLIRLRDAQKLKTKKPAQLAFVAPVLHLRARYRA